MLSDAKAVTSAPLQGLDVALAGDGQNAQRLIDRGLRLGRQRLQLLGCGVGQDDLLRRL